MKIFFITLFFTLNTHAQHCDKLSEIRNIFQVGINNKKELNDMISTCEKSNCNKIIPYHAAATMRKAEFVWSPLSKLSNFNKGKKMLENFIKQQPNNIEARYVRWLTQKMAPSFLGYHNNLKNDYDFIIKNIAKSGLELSYQKTMIQQLKN